MEVDLGRHQKARVWLGESPLPSPPFGVVVLRSVGAAFDDRTVATRVVVEEWLPREPLLLYGMLGARFAPDPASSSVVVEVPVALAMEPLDQTKTLSRQAENLSIGLTDQLAQVVADEAAKELESTPLPPGRLRFDVAVTGSVGSVPIVFKGLTRAVVRLVGRTSDEPTEVKRLLSGSLP